jgi:alpha-1,4-digalacturonate transport system substrate-binding protein
MLDLRPYLSAPAYWDENFGPFLAWMQTEADGNAIPGFMTQLTVTGPFINRTLFEQAGVAVPSDASDQVTWQEWVAAAREVAAATDTFALAMDRSGHRLAGPAVSMGATYFDADGNPALVGDQGFKDMAQLMIDWHADGTMIPEVWIGSAGSYQAANEPFVNGQLAMYMSGRADRPVQHQHRRCLRLGSCPQSLWAGWLHGDARWRGARGDQYHQAP